MHPSIAIIMEQFALSFEDAWDALARNDWSLQATIVDLQCRRGTVGDCYKPFVGAILLAVVVVPFALDTIRAVIH